MKKLTLIFCSIICFQSVYSQGWLDVGLKGGYGLNFLVNKNLYNDHYFSPKLSSGYIFGGKIGVNINQSHAITIDLTSSSLDQAYRYSLDSNVTTFTRSIGYNALNVNVMYRNTTNASYFEIGPQFSMISKTRYSDDLTKTDKLDIDTSFVKSYYGVAMGFGGYLIGTENFRVILGFRLSYALNDIISESGKLINFPSFVKYENYSPSKPLTAMMMLELNYDIGYFTKSNCKKRKTSFILFSN